MTQRRKTDPENLMTQRQNRIREAEFDPETEQARV